MIECGLSGVWMVDGRPVEDPNEQDLVVWDRTALRRHDLDVRVAQCNLAMSHQRGTIRGLHWQKSPFEEVKIVRALRGRIFDVAVDLRPHSPTFRRWIGLELAEDHPRALYVPAGFAHGYQTLTDEVAVLYTVSAAYSPLHQGGARWNDPAFGIEWPLAATMIHERDAAYPDFRWDDAVLRKA